MALPLASHHVSPLPRNPRPLRLLPRTPGRCTLAVSFYSIGRRSARAASFPVPAAISGDSGKPKKGPPREGRGKPGKGPPGEGAEIPKAVPEISKGVPDISEVVPEISDVVPEISEEVPEVPKVELIVDNIVSEVPKAVSELANAVTEVPKVVTEVGEAAPEIPNVVPEAPQFVPEIPTVAPDAAEVVPLPEDSEAVPEVSNVVSDKLEDLKLCLLDTFFGTEYGLKASAEVRGEVAELVGQLEAENPTPAPVESPELLDGNWILLYTSFSELLPLIAVGTTPLLKVKKITQAIDTKSSTILNSITLSSPVVSFSFSASASFEVQSPSRIQVRFKEGTVDPPVISSSIDLPANVDIFGQKIDLPPLQQTLSPLQEAVGNIARVISGQPPLKFAIPGDRTASWLITTFLDKDLRISRGDRGLFILAKEGAPLLDQLL